MVSQALTLTMKTNYKGYIRTDRNASEGKKGGDLDYLKELNSRNWPNI